MSAVLGCTSFTAHAPVALVGLLDLSTLVTDSVTCIGELSGDWVTIS